MRGSVMKKNGSAAFKASSPMKQMTATQFKDNLFLGESYKTSFTLQKSNLC